MSLPIRGYPRPHPRREVVRQMLAAAAPEIARADYWRWQGHAEARRQLCEAIGGPCRCGHHTSRIANGKGTDAP